jgi:small conductance mechanosensitive channel
MDFNFYFLYEKMIIYGGNILLAVIFLIIGLRVIKVLTNKAAQKLAKAEVDPSLKPFLVLLIRTLLLILLIISIASMIGIEMTSFIAVIAAVSFAIGLALQGSLANFAGGVLILLLKPFKVDDYIEAAGYAGTVKDIQIFYTVLNTPDNKQIVIPNANLSNNSIINYSANPTRRVDFSFSAGYEDNIETVKLIIKKIALNNTLVLNDPPPEVVLGEHGESAVIFYLRVWCKKEDYWTIYFDIIEKVKIEFDKEGINIPYPQNDIRIINAQK